ncbi:hypothetical protein [Novosphingobium sp.]
MKIERIALVVVRIVGAVRKTRLYGLEALDLPLGKIALGWS